MQLTDQHQQISTFAELVKAGIEAWAKAGKLLVTMLAEDHMIVDKICSANPWLSPETLFRFEQIGLGQVSPQLLLSDSPGVRSLRALPLNLQERHATEPISLLVHDAGKSDVLKVHVKNLTPAQTRQVFAKDHIRDIAEQRAFLFDRSPGHIFPALDSQLPYKIKNGCVQMKANCTFTAKQLAEILAQLK